MGPEYAELWIVVAQKEKKYIWKEEKNIQLIVNTCLHIQITGYAKQI